jgi:hypothetical protein
VSPLLSLYEHSMTTTASESSKVPDGTVITRLS